jgi:hypothetical protein
MKKCERCTVNHCSWTHDISSLKGDVTAHLCTACLRGYRRYLQTEHRAAWEADRESTAQFNYLKGRASAGQAPTLAEWQDWHWHENAVSDMLHTAALAYLAQCQEAAVPVETDAAEGKEP